MVLIGLHLVIFVWSGDFAYGVEAGGRSFTCLLLIELAACLCYTVSVGLLRIFPAGRFSLGLILLVGIGLRVLMMTVEPIRANDYYRYLWDGAVTANGLNPYAYSPEEVLAGVDETSEASDVPVAYRELAMQSTTTLTRINHAELRTIYPPGTQALFAGAYWLTPFRTAGWRVVLLLLDVVTLGLLLVLLRGEKMSLGYVVIYWWNPLLIYETFAKCHFDMAIGVWLLLFVGALSKHRAILAGTALALAVSIKLWPLLLLPFLLLTFRHDRRRLWMSAGVFAVIMGLGAILFYPAGANVADSGVVAYAQSWQGNAGLYHGINWLMQQVSAMVEIDAGLAARVAAVALVFTISCWLAYRTETDVISLAAGVGVVVMLMLLVSPVMYPWYYLPVLPLAVVTRKWTFVSLTLLLPISYVYGEVTSLVWLVWLIHIPVWGLLWWEFWLAKKIRQRRHTR